MTAEPTGFLYPFIEADERDPDRLLADLARSARSKLAESRTVRAVTIEACRDATDLAGAAMARRFAAGGRAFAFGNGGSATDADLSVALFRTPPHGQPLPAVALVDEQAVVTALANDIGFDFVFSRQLIAHARPTDIAIGFSTSGGSRNVLEGLREARKRGLLTIGFAGYDGGAMRADGALDHCLVVRSDSVHRIQEAQSALLFDLWSSVQRSLPEVSHA